MPCSITNIVLSGRNPELNLYLSGGANTQFLYDGNISVLPSDLFFEDRVSMVKVKYGNAKDLRKKIFEIGKNYNTSLIRVAHEGIILKTAESASLLKSVGKDSHLLKTIGKVGCKWKEEPVIFPVTEAAAIDIISNKLQGVTEDYMNVLERNGMATFSEMRNGLYCFNLTEKGQLIRDYFSQK